MYAAIPQPDVHKQTYPGTQLCVFPTSYDIYSNLQHIRAPCSFAVRTPMGDPGWGSYHLLDPGRGHVEFPTCGLGVSVDISIDRYRMSVRNLVGKVGDHTTTGFFSGVGGIHH